MQEFSIDGLGGRGQLAVGWTVYLLEIAVSPVGEFSRRESGSEIVRTIGWTGSRPPCPALPCPRMRGTL